jgi:RNA polymerase sigma factor (sigma-70 family)
VERDSDDVVYEKYADELIRFATALVGPSDAADILSMAVLRVFASRRWPDVHNQRAYLTRAVLNEARMNHRSAMRRRAREHRFAPRDRVEAPELRPEVLARVGRLSVRQRAVVVLTYWDDLDPVEISRRLGISPGSVRRHLARAHGQLREMMKDDE